MDAPHFELVESARKTLLEASFKPGLKDGVPSLLDIEIDVQFYVPGADRTAHQSTLDHLESMQYQMDPEAVRYFLCKADTLDAPLTVVERGPQYVPHDAAGRRLGGSAVIECIIDDRGIPHLFRIARSDGAEIAESALLSIQSMRFSSPRQDGRPVVVKVRIPMNYTAPAGD